MSDETKTRTQSVQGTQNLQIQQLFKVMVDNGASDLHITVGTSPGMRISGEVISIILDIIREASSRVI